MAIVSWRFEYDSERIPNTWSISSLESLRDLAFPIPLTNVPGNDGCVAYQAQACEDVDASKGIMFKCGKSQECRAQL